jgi:hypothetical protein
MKKTPKNIPTYYNSKGTPIYRDTTAVLFNNGGDKKTPPKKSKPTSTLPSTTPFPSIGNPLLVNQGLVNLGYNPLDGNVQYIGPQNPNAGTESFFNPMNWNVPRMDTEPTFEGAFEKAKRAGHGEFIYNGKRYTTESNMTPAQQMQSYGITDSRRILNPSQARTNLSTLNTEEGYSGGAEAAVARMLGVSPGIQFAPNEREAPGAKEQDAFKLYLGLPQTYNTFKPSNYKKGALELTDYNALLPDTMPSDADIKKYGVPEYSNTWKKGNPLKPYDDFIMGRHTVQKGKDAKGEYIEYTDKWDLDTFGKAGEYADYLNQPFDIYGRKYYKDYGDGVKKTMYYSDQELQNFDPNNKNFDTLALQKELANRGYKFPKSTTKAGEFDGVYGEETKKALLDWQNKNFKAGEIYSFSDRPGSYYKYNEDGTMLIKNKNTNGKYIPMVDKEGKRLKTLQAGLISGKTKKLLDGGPLVDKTNHGDLLPSVYASALGNYYAQGGMIKRADGSYSPRGLWDNIRAAAAKNKAAGKPGKEPSEKMLAQAKKIEAEEKQMGGYLYSKGGQFPTPYSLPEDSFKQGGNNLHNSVYASSMAQYPAVYKYGGSFEMPRQQMYMPLDNVERYGGQQQNAKTFFAGGENHKVYIKTSPTGNGEGVEGHIMVNHPTKDKGQWDTIDLTKKAGAKTVAQGVAATKQWHAEHPNNYQNGGSVFYATNTPQLEGEGKDLTYPKNAYIYAVGGAINNFNDGGAMNFKSKGAYQKWLAYGHASGEFAKTPGNQPVSIKGKSHNVEHQYGGALFAAGGSFNNPGFNALPVAVQNKIRANSFEAGGTMDQLTEFNAGGTHEENPLGGIPQGMAPDGRLNLVEQGETKLKETDEGGGNFVYSDSIKVDRQFAEEYSLPNSYIGKTYAEASKLANRPKSRRENDTIEQTDIKRKLDSLAEAQEAQKAKEQQEQTAQELAANPQLLEALTQQLAANQSVQPMGIPQGEEVSPDQVPPEMLAQMEGAQQGMPIMRCGGHMYMCGGKMYDFGGWMDDNSGAVSGAGTGALSGASTGATIGSVIPGIGTVVGAGIGALVGGIAGGVSGHKKDKQEQAAENAAKQEKIAEGNMMQRMQDPSYVTPTAQYALNAGAGTGATYTYPVKKGGPIYHQYPQINPMWKNNAGPMGQGLANTQIYAMGGNMMAEGGPAKLNAQEQATIQKEWEATYGKLPAGQQVFIDQSSYDNWKKTGNLEGIYSLDIPPAPATKTAESADNQFYYTDYATGQPIYDVDPITGEKVARLAPEGSKQNIQYPQYATQAAGAPQVQAKKQAVQDEIMRNQNLIKQLSQEQLQEMRSLKMTPEAYIQEKQINVLPFGQAGAYTFADGGVISSFDPSLMATTENNFIRKLSEGGDEDYSEEDMAVDRITISEIKAKIDNGEELTDDDKAAYQSALERLNEGLDSQDLDFGIKVKPIELAAMAAPAAYNIGTGLFGKVQQLNPEDYTVKGQIDPYQYNIVPELREAGYGFAAGQDALRNASTGSAYLSNVQGLYNTRNKYMSELYSKKQNLDAANYQAAQQANLELQQQNAASRLGILDWNARAQNAKRMALQEGLKETADIGKAFVDMRGQRALVKSYAPDYADTLKFLLDRNNKGE